MTKAQTRVLAAIKAGQFFVYAGDLTAARSLASLGYVTLTDNGAPVEGRNADRERWSVELTAAGEVAYVESLVDEYGAACVKVGQGILSLGSESQLRAKIGLLDAIKAVAGMARATR